MLNSVTSQSISDSVRGSPVVIDDGIAISSSLAWILILERLNLLYSLLLMALQMPFQSKLESAVFSTSWPWNAVSWSWRSFNFSLMSTGTTWIFVYTKDWHERYSSSLNGSKPGWAVSCKCLKLGGLGAALLEDELHLICTYLHLTIESVSEIFQFFV